MGFLELIWAVERFFRGQKGQEALLRAAGLEGMALGMRAVWGHPDTVPLPSLRSWLSLHPRIAAPYKPFLTKHHHSVLTSMTNTHSWPS